MQPGNKNGVKLKEPDVRQLAYKKYCEHLANGKSQRSFTFRHQVVDENGEEKEYACHWQTIESYIKDKTEFNPLHKQMALCEGYAKWEQIVEDSADGTNKDANTASLQMVMRNKFDWDKPESDEKKYPKSEIIKVMVSDVERLEPVDPKS